ncbi:MAG: transposase [Parachlamydiales bacterium]
MILDASGLKVIGDGEWKVKVHGQGRRRQWIKVHLGVDAQSQEIVAEMTTASEVCDGKMTGFLLNQVKGKVKGVLADGGYDERSARDQVKARGAKAHIPPRRNGRLRGDPDRDEALRIMHGLGNMLTLINLDTGLRYTELPKRKIAGGMANGRSSEKALDGGS